MCVGLLNLFGVMLQKMPDRSSNKKKTVLKSIVKLGDSIGTEMSPVRFEHAYGLRPAQFSKSSF